MRLYKRREWTLVCGDIRIPFEAVDQKAAEAKATQTAAAKQLSNWSLERDPTVCYTFQFHYGGQLHRKNTGQTDKRQAQEYARRYLEALKSGRLEDLRELSFRQTVPTITLGEIVKRFQAYASVEHFAKSTPMNYITSLKLVLERAGRTGWEGFPVSSLTPRLVYDYRAAIAEMATKEKADDARRRQLEASANSTLTQARALFSRRALEYYREVAGLTLPDLQPFLRAPGFPEVQKTDYRMPSDAVVAATFQHLPELATTDRDVFVAIWLALGFGLRKSEIGAVRAGWFRQTPTGVELELRSTVIPKTIQEKSSTKNGTVCPVIPETNGAWSHLEPLLRDLGPEDYVLRCGAASARTATVFRRLGAWLTAQGWETEKKCHELRAYAGCQVAMRDGIEAASKWLRHSSIVVTQQNYGRYLRPKISRAELDIPKVEPFVPRVVGND